MADVHVHVDKIVSFWPPNSFLQRAGDDTSPVHCMSDQYTNTEGRQNCQFLTSKLISTMC